MGMDFDSMCIQRRRAGLMSSRRFPENHSLLNPVYVVCDGDRKAIPPASWKFRTLIYFNIAVMTMRYRIL